MTNHTDGLDAAGVEELLERLTKAHRHVYLHSSLDGEGFGWRWFFDLLNDSEKAISHLVPYKDELLKIAEQVGEPDDPFAAWESISTRSALVDAPAGERELARQLVNAFSIYTIEDDDGIRLSTGGHTVAHYGEHSPEGMALLKLEAHCRELRTALASPTPSVAALQAEIERLRKLLDSIIARDDRNGSLPEWYRHEIDANYSSKPAQIVE